MPANEIVGCGPGELFVHRNIANLVVNNDNSIQSVFQYAVEYLQVPFTTMPLPPPPFSPSSIFLKTQRCLRTLYSHAVLSVPWANSRKPASSDKVGQHHAQPVTRFGA